MIVEAMQRGFGAGADDSALCGDLEKAALWFHQSLDEAMALRQLQKTGVFRASKI